MFCVKFWCFVLKVNSLSVGWAGVVDSFLSEGQKSNEKGCLRFRSSTGQFQGNQKSSGIPLIYPLVIYQNLPELRVCGWLSDTHGRRGRWSPPLSLSMAFGSKMANHDVSCMDLWTYHWHLSPQIIPWGDSASSRSIPKLPLTSTGRCEIYIDSSPARPSAFSFRAILTPNSRTRPAKIVTWHVRMPQKQAQKKQPPMVHSERLGTTFLDIRTACHISQKAATLGATTTGPSRGSISRTWVQRMKWTSWWGWKGWKNAMDVNDLRITDGGSSDQHPKKNQDRFSNFTKSSRFAGSGGVYMTHPQGASSDPRRHEGRCKDTALPVPRGCLGCSKWGGYPLNSRQFQIILIGKMNKARNSRGIPPFQPSCLQDMISFPWVQPLGNFQSRAALCSRAAVAYFVTLSSHTSLPTCNWVVLSTTDWGFGSASTTAPVAECRKSGSWKPSVVHV